MPVGIVHVSGDPVDSIDRPLGEREREPGARARGETRNGVEHGVYAGCPAGSLAIIHKVAYARRLVDRPAQARLERPVVGVHERCVRVQFSKQGKVPLGQAHDHLDKGIDAFRLQMIANARERAGAFGFGAAASGIRRKRRRHHVLAEPPVLESGAGALSWFV